MSKLGETKKVHGDHMVGVGKEAYDFSMSQ